MSCDTQSIDISFADIGLKGDKGDKGDTGAKGDKGDTGAQGDVGSQRTKYNEEPVGLINGVNTIFICAELFIVTTTRLYLNGLRQKIGNDYTEQAQSITFIDPPYSGDEIIIDYDY